MANLGDLLAGAAGAPVNRPALDAYITQGQALAGLRSAQTEDALTRAQQAREEMDAGDKLESALAGSGLTPSQAKSAALIMKAHFGNAQQALEAHKLIQDIQNRGVLGDPTQLGTPAQTAAQQGIQGKVAEPFTVPNQYAVPAGAPQPTVQQTPMGEAETNQHQAQANLANAQAENPALFHPGGANAVGQLPPELQKAVDEHRLDPRSINSRNVSVLGQLARGNPTLDFNRMHADAQLQANPTFQQRSMTMEALPEIMAHMTDLGKKVGYSDVGFVGRAQKWLNGELNDPAMEEYMTVRNDALMSIANTMRGVGMSDQAHRAEIEAASPTLSPAALDAWLRGQNATLQPRLRRVQAITHHDNSTAGVAPTGAAPQAAGAAPPAGPSGTDPLGLFSQGTH